MQQYIPAVVLAIVVYLYCTSLWVAMISFASFSFWEGSLILESENPFTCDFSQLPKTIPFLFFVYNLHV